MQKQNPLSVFLLTFITFGIYGIVWMARTRGEMVRKGADIPTTFLIIVPFVNIYYLWKWSQGVEHVTNGKMSWVIAFLLEWILGPIGMAIIQDGFNNVADVQQQPQVANNAPAEPQEQAPPTSPSPTQTV